MSRIGKKPVPVPAAVTVKVDGPRVTVKGKNGELSLAVHERVSVRFDE